MLRQTKFFQDDAEKESLQCTIDELRSLLDDAHRQIEAFKEVFLLL